MTALFLSLLAETAWAAYGQLGNAVGGAGSVLPSVGDSFVEIAHTVVVRFRPLLSVGALLAIVIAGYRMIVAQEDDSIDKMRAVMSGTIAGLVMVWLIEPFIEAFYTAGGAPGSVSQGAIGAGASVLELQVLGIVDWVLTIVAVLAVLMIIIEGAKSFGEATSEEGIGNIRKTIFSVIFGIVLLVLRFALSYLFIGNTRNPVPILEEFLKVVVFVLTFLALAAVVMCIYAGVLYVLSLGKEEQASKAKGLLIRVLIGTVVILLSLALVRFVIIIDPTFAAGGFSR